jgi:hypothetical protein
MDQAQGKTYPSAAKRLTHSMCQPCIEGFHERCPSHDCPCPCNDGVIPLPKIRKSASLGTLAELLESA